MAVMKVKFYHFDLAPDSFFDTIFSLSSNERKHDNDNEQWISTIFFDGKPLKLIIMQWLNKWNILHGANTNISSIIIYYLHFMPGSSDAEDHVRRYSGNNLHGKYTKLCSRPPLQNLISCPNSNNFICYSYLTLQSKLVSSGMKLKAKVRMSVIQDTGC